MGVVRPRRDGSRLPKDLAAFEHEIDRLVADLADIRLEAQLRFADHAAKRYRVTSRWPILFRIK